MAYKKIVSDWNFTAVRFNEDLPNKRIVKAIVEKTKGDILKGKFWKASKLLSFLKAKTAIESKLNEYEKGNCHPSEIYKFFNEYFLKGQDPAFVMHVLDEFARDSKELVDLKLLIPIYSAHLAGKGTAILSVACNYTIQAVLNNIGFKNLFDDIIANTMQIENGKLTGFTQNIYGEKQDIVINEFFQKQGFRDNELIYIGDSKDDEPVAEILAPGHFVVSFMASDEFKQHMASTYQAVVPENKNDLYNVLRKR